jgi:hypothetical protein
MACEEDGLHSLLRANCWVDVGLTGDWRKIHDEKLHPVYMVCCFQYYTPYIKKLGEFGHQKVYYRKS